MHKRYFTAAFWSKRFYIVFIVVVVAVADGIAGVVFVVAVADAIAGVVVVVGVVFNRQDTLL